MKADTKHSVGPKVLWNHDNQRMVELLNVVGEEECVKIVHELFSDLRDVALEPLSQGKSGSVVFLAHPVREDGTPEVYRAVKIGDVTVLRSESERYKDHVQDTLGQHAELGRQYLPKEGKGAIAYTLIGGGEDQIKPLSQLFDGALRGLGGDAKDLCRRVNCLFETCLNSWYSYGKDSGDHLLFKDSFNLDKEQLSELQKLATARSQSGGENLDWGLDKTVENWRWWIMHEPHVHTDYCVIHGDLHLDNIILNTTTGKLCLIDFGLTGRDHFLKDFVKLETDLKFRFIRSLTTTDDQCQAVQNLLGLERKLTWASAEAAATTEGQGPIPAWFVRVVEAIRRQARRRMGGPPRAAEYTVGLIRYAFRMALYTDTAITKDHRFSMLHLGAGYFRYLQLGDPSGICWVDPEAVGGRSADRALPVGPEPASHPRTGAVPAARQKIGGIRRGLGVLQIGPSERLGNLPKEQLGLLGDPILVVGDAFSEGGFVGNFIGICKGKLKVKWNPKDPPVLPDYVIEYRRQIERTSTGPNWPKVFLNGWQPPIVDDENEIKLALCKSDWWMRKALDEKVELVRRCILGKESALKGLSLPFDVQAAVITSDNKVVIAYRGDGVHYHKRTWSIPGEQMDAEKDFEIESGSPSPWKTAIRVLTDTDELSLPKAAADSAKITFIGMATQWDLLCTNLITVVDLPQTSAAAVAEYFPKGEQLFVHFEEFEPDNCLRNVLRDDFSIPVPRSLDRAKLTDIARISILVALFHRFGYEDTRHKIKALSEAILRECEREMY